ncbi:uncharacterized protein LOC123308170 [Coccinella septempunctata]|uniref:uncharacterized protein LOC123308170 n=1 Tax=Coccinella septempunctata TaxID=41139 RepID=UPI001D08DDD6|nr:uncharacterized protein LOC123308170 [Coccinella septempunctata]
MDNSRLHQTFDSYERPLASSTFIGNEKKKPYNDSNARNKYMEYDAFREGNVKNKISFWEEHSRKFAEKHGFVDVPQKKIAKTKFKLVKSGIYSCSGPHPGFHFISSETVTSTGSSGYITTSNRVTSISTPTSESGIDSNEEQHVDEDVGKFDEEAKSQENSDTDMGIYTSYETENDMNDYFETEESAESTNEVDWNDPVDCKEEITQMTADFVTEVSQDDPTEVRPTRNLFLRIHRAASMYTKEIVLFYVFFRIAAIILSLLS